MLEQIESSIRDLFSTLQIAKLYTIEHPRCKQYLEKSYGSIQTVLREKGELVIGIIGDELVFEKDIFFDLSKTVKPTIGYLKERGIEKIIFTQIVQKEELVQFIGFLAMQKNELKMSIQEYLTQAGIKSILAGKIQPSSSPAGIAGKFDASGAYNNYLDHVTNTVETVLNSENLDYLNLRFNMVNVMENLLMYYQDFLKLATLKKYDVGTFMHIMNVSILSMYFSSRIGFEKNDVLDVGIAALFHDIGKVYISRKIIIKPQRLTDEEFLKIKSHVILGAEILLKYVDTLGILPVVVCFEHHLKYDTKGYPKLSFYQKPHIASLVVAICDVYDALSQKRSYKRDYPPRAIYDLMMKERGIGFEPRLLDKFFSIMGVWPIGTLLSLTDKSIAVVREQNDDNMFLPKVEVIYPVEKKQTINLKETKGKIEIENFLNPLKEGKEYLHLA